MTTFLTTALRRRWLTLLVVALATFALTLILALTSSPEYRAESRVLVSDRDFSSLIIDLPMPNGGTRDDVATELALARLPAVEDRARNAVADPSVPSSAQVSLDTAPTASGTTNLLRFSVVSTDADHATDLATAMADAFVAFRRSQETSAVRRARAGIAERLSDLQSRGEADSRTYQALQDRLDQLDTLLLLGESRIQRIEGAPTAEQVSPAPVRAGVTGAMGGLLAGLIAAVALHWLDPRLRSDEEIVDAFGIPLFAHLPDPAAPDAKHPKLPARNHAATADGEAFRTLRANLTFALAAEQTKSLLVTSAAPEEGKSFVSANLALTAAVAGDDVILVDADLHRPSLHHYLALPKHVGLTDLTARQLTLDDALIEVALPHALHPEGRLRLLQAGTLLPNAGSLAQSGQVQEILAALATAGDLMIVDTPPVLAYSDALALSGSVGAALIVCRRPRANRRQIRAARGHLGGLDVATKFLVLTASSPNFSRYSYGYGYGRTDQPASRLRSWSRSMTRRRPQKTPPKPDAPS